MAFDLSTAIADDFDLFDGAETVTYQRRSLTGSGDTADAAVTGLKRATTGQAVSLGGGAQVVIDVARWHLKASTLATPPRPCDRIVSASHGTWEILEDGVESLGTRYVCTCKRVPTQ
jgi:hypothetical protein